MVEANAVEDKATKVVCCDICNGGHTKTFIGAKLAPISDRVDADPRNRTKSLVNIFREVLLFVCKEANFGTMRNHVVNKGTYYSERTSKLTLGVFLQETRCS